MREAFIVEYKDYITSFSVNVFLYDQKADMYEKELGLSKSFDDKETARMYATHIRRMLTEKIQRITTSLRNEDKTC